MTKTHRCARRALHAAGFALSLAMAGCASIAPSPQSSQQSAALYETAIADAAVASPRKVTALLPLPATEKVSVVSWVVESRVPCNAPSTTCATTTPLARIWVTLAGEVQARCRAWGLQGDDLRRRLEQLLGLPMDPPAQFRKTHFVTMEVARERIDRPCLGVDESDPQRPVCSIGVQAQRPADIRDYVLRQMADSFVVGDKVPGYPFTRLGYTYDWHPSDARPNHYGASEFLVRAGTPATVLAQQTADAYCAR